MRSIESRPGPYNGERVHSVFDGDVGGLATSRYTLDVEATGPWRVRLFQERAVSGDDGGSWLQLEEGEYTMTTNHTVTADFIVELFDSRGLPPYHIVKATGDHEGEARFTVGGGAPGENPQAGIHAIGVLSEGDWSATITSNDAQ